MNKNERRKLVRILALLGSDQPGERAAAALAAQRAVTAAGLTWEEILEIGAATGPARRPRSSLSSEWGIDHADAARSRERQLHAEADRLRHQITILKRRLDRYTEAERKARFSADEA